MRAATPTTGPHTTITGSAALERLVTGRDLIDPAVLTERKDAWADAYRRTPHGQPVELRGSS